MWQFKLGGPFTIQAQALATCDFQTLAVPIIVTTRCNAGARFVCGGGATGPYVPATGLTTCQNNVGGALPDPTAVYPTTVQYNCAENMFQPVFVSMGVDAGGDAASNGDALTLTAAFSGAVSPFSWWSKAYTSATVKWTIRVPESARADLIQDGTGCVVWVLERTV